MSADVCVVGAGPAGITVARELAARGTSVCLLESGGFELDRETQALNAGKASGTAPRMRDAYLRDTRLRFFGGTTNHWAGQCRPLDPIDFEVRDWIPHSGWPFPRTALEPFYERAGTLLGLEPFDDGVDASGPGGQDFLFSRQHAAVVARGFQYRALRFGKTFREEIVSSPAISLHLHASAVDLVANRAGTAVERLRVATLAGRSFSVGARRFVIAAGAIENARLLLLSDGVQRGGLGNQHDLVGRFFMEHPHFYEGLGAVAIWQECLAQLYLPGAATLFFPSPALMRAQRMSHLAVNLVEQREDMSELDHQMTMSAQDLDRGGRRGQIPQPPSLRAINVQAEQTPNPDSRVTLAASTDALGARRVTLDWQLSPVDLESVDRFIGIMCRELARGGVGRGRRAAVREELAGLATWGSHHMGTTRMHGDPHRGVVDADCRVHGLGNLYVAGSSVFPTSGAANPTFTILALAFRLAEHLGARPTEGQEVIGR